jgi:hypothetical protein
MCRGATPKTVTLVTTKTMNVDGEEFSMLVDEVEVDDVLIERRPTRADGGMTIDQRRARRQALRKTTG